MVGLGALVAVTVAVVEVGRWAHKGLVCPGTATLADSEVHRPPEGLVTVVQDALVENSGIASYVVLAAKIDSIGPESRTGVGARYVATGFDIDMGRIEPEVRIGMEEHNERDSSSGFAARKWGLEGLNTN